MEEKCINRSMFHKEMCPDECTGHNDIAMGCHYIYRRFPLGTLDISDRVDALSTAMSIFFQALDKHCSNGCLSNCQECNNPELHHIYDTLEKLLKELANKVVEETS